MFAKEKNTMSRREQFKQWLIKTGKPGAATNYPNSIVRISEHYSEQTGKQISLYDDISDQKEISRIAGLYKQDGEFSEFGYKFNGLYRNAIARYSEFFADQFVENDGETPPETTSTADAVAAAEAAVEFRYEQDLQRTLCSQISELFPGYNIVRREYSIRGKRIDVLLEHADNKNLLVVELKAGKADEAVFGQISMYIGMLGQEPKYADRKIEGVIVASAIDKGLHYARKTNKTISVKTYRINLELEDSDLLDSEEDDV